MDIKFYKDVWPGDTIKMYNILNAVNIIKWIKKNLMSSFVNISDLDIRRDLIKFNVFLMTSA